MEVHFEYSVEDEDMSEGEYKTPKEALADAEERWQEMCDNGDYEHGKNYVEIFAVNSETLEVVLRGSYRVYSEQDYSEPPYMQKDFI